MIEDGHILIYGLFATLIGYLLLISDQIKPKEFWYFWTLSFTCPSVKEVKLLQLLQKHSIHKTKFQSGVYILYSIDICTNTKGVKKVYVRSINSLEWTIYQTCPMKRVYFFLVSDYPGVHFRAQNWTTHCVPQIFLE